MPAIGAVLLLSLALQVFGGSSPAVSSDVASWHGAYIGGDTAEDKMFYAVGETMTFRLRVGGVEKLPPGEWKIRWRRTGDDGVTESGAEPVSLGNPCEIRTSLDRPGFVRLQASIDGAPDAVRFDGGAGADFGGIVSRTDEPADFDAFWRRQLSALDQVPIAPKLTEVPSPRPDVRLFAFELGCTGGRPSTGYLSVPTAEGPFPVRLFFFGYNHSWTKAVHSPPRADELSAKEIRLRVSAHGLALGRDEAYYAAAKASVAYGDHFQGWNPAENERPETCYFLNMILRDVRAAQYAATLEKWNGRDLAVEGGSQGAFQAVLVAALCPRVSSASVFINWFCDLGGRASGGRLASEFEPEYRRGLAYFDEAFHARRIGRSAFVNVTYAALGDYVSPPTGIACFYNALRCRKRICWRQNAEHLWQSPAPNQAMCVFSDEPRAGARLLEPLAPGEVKPRGWLLDRARAMADGYTGHAHEYHPDFALPWTSAFKEPRPAPHCWPYECGAYWLDGLVRLAYELDDPALIALVRARVEPVLSEINANSILFYTCMSRTNAVDRQNFAKEPFFVRAAGQYARGLWAYCQATGDARALEAFRLAYGGAENGLNGVLSVKGVSSIMDAYGKGVSSGAADWSALARMFDVLFDRRQVRREGWPWHDYLDFPKKGDAPYLNRKGGDFWAKWHGVMMCETLGSLAMGTLWTGDRYDLEKSLAWRDLVDSTSLQVHGAVACDEHLVRTSAYRGTETCVVAGQLWDDVIFLSLSGEARFADHAERLALNAAPVCTSRDARSHVYFQSPNRVLAAASGGFTDGPGPKGGVYAREHFPRCCMAALNRILPIQIQHLWMKRENGLAAVMYGPNVLKTTLGTAGTVRIESVTDYPFGENVRMKIAVEKPASFPVWLRIPDWCERATVNVKGAQGAESVPVSPEAGWQKVERTWRTGDEIEIVLPQQVAVSQGVDVPAGNAPYATVTLGPLVMALNVEGADENTHREGAAWQFAYDPSLFTAKVVRKPVPTGFAWDADAPVSVAVTLASAAWKHDVKHPMLPRDVTPGKATDVKLVPYGCSRMRVSMFPVAAP